MERETKMYLESVIFPCMFILKKSIQANITKFESLSKVFSFVVTRINYNNQNMMEEEDMSVIF